MGLLNTKPEVRVEKEEANPTYETYGRKGEVDYIVNYKMTTNHQTTMGCMTQLKEEAYGPRFECIHYMNMKTPSFQVETKASKKSSKCCLFTVVICVTMILLGLVGAIFHLTHGKESYLELHL